MKKNRVIGMVFAATMMFSACNTDDFLGIKPRGKEIASTCQHYDGLFNSLEMIYYGEMAGPMFYSTVMSDEFYSTPQSLEQLNQTSGGPQAQAAYCWETEIMRVDETCGEWNYGQNLYVYNMIINEVMNASDGTEAEKLSLQSEARVMRAYLHFCNAQFFCKPYHEETASTDLGLPIIKEANTNTESFERGTLKEFYDFILQEMEESCPNIQNATNHLFRAEKADAYAMLGNIYFFMRQYDKALTNLRLAKQYADENGASFLYNLNEQTDMWITEMPTHFSNQENMMDLCAWLNPFTYYSFFYNPATIYVKEEYYNLFSENDRRKFRFVMEGEDEYWRSTQYYVNLGPTSPELYLTLAECEAREGDEETAKALLYELRKTRMPEDEAALPATITDRNSLIRYCVEERIREQLGTGKFWLDMRRLWNDPLFQDYKENYAHPIGDEVYKLTEERLVMRIPPLVMQWNPGWQDND